MHAVQSHGSMVLVPILSHLKESRDKCCLFRSFGYGRVGLCFSGESLGRRSICQLVQRPMVQNFPMFADTRLLQLRTVASRVSLFLASKRYLTSRSPSAVLAVESSDSIDSQRSRQQSMHHCARPPQFPSVKLLLRPESSTSRSNMHRTKVVPEQEVDGSLNSQTPFA